MTSLDGVDTKNKTVTQLADGSWEIFESSVSGMQRIARESESALSLQFDMNEVPEYLKCPLSHTFLREAVCLPCCRQCVNDTVIRQQLLATNMACPLCQQPNVALEALVTRADIRNSVEGGVISIPLTKLYALTFLSSLKYLCFLLMDTHILLVVNDLPLLSTLLFPPL